MKNNRISLVFLPFILFSSLFAQKYPELFQYYKERQIVRLQNKLSQLTQTDPDNNEIQFFNAYFLESGEDAVIIYETLFKNSYSPLKNLIADKIADYNYARGFYVKAEEYKKISLTLFPAKTQEEKKTVDNIQKKTETVLRQHIYMIQVGAFGVEENARDLARSLSDNLSVNVVNKSVDGKNLYCVWVAGRDNLKETEELAREIKQKYNLSYRIIKP